MSNVCNESDKDSQISYGVCPSGHLQMQLFQDEQNVVFLLYSSSIEHKQEMYEYCCKL